MVGTWGPCMRRTLSYPLRATSLQNPMPLAQSDAADLQAWVAARRDRRGVLFSGRRCDGSRRSVFRALRRRRQDAGQPCPAARFASGLCNMATCARWPQPGFRTPDWGFEAGTLVPTTNNLRHLSCIWCSCAKHTTTCAMPRRCSATTTSSPPAPARRSAFGLGPPCQTSLQSVCGRTTQLSRPGLVRSRHDGNSCDGLPEKLDTRCPIRRQTALI